MNSQENLTYEQKVERIKEIIEKLQNNSLELPLEEVASLYEEAVRLTKQCEEYLRKVENRIIEIGNLNAPPKSENLQNDNELPGFLKGDNEDENELPF